MSKLLLQNGTIVQAAHTQTFQADLLIDGPFVADVAPAGIAPGDARCIDCTGKLILPGLVDMHIHLSGSLFSHKMLARAGVTTAMDLCGMPTEIADGIVAGGAGLNLAFLFPIIPGRTVSSTDPDRAELETCIDRALQQGALGIKIIGGHYPISGRAISTIIALCADRKCWVCHHSGSLETPGDFRGFVESFKLADGNPLHIAHINSYCRGNHGQSPLEEARQAIELLSQHPNCRSESYLATINGTSGRCENGVPASLVTCRCLQHRGYEPTLPGLEQAIIDGWAQVHGDAPNRQETVLLPPAEGMAHYRECSGHLRLSFAVNSLFSAIPLALAKKQDGTFVVDALATDGGSIPRNLTLKLGLSLVEMGGLSMNELAHKASAAPARLLGLDHRGDLLPGYVADLVIVDPLRKAAEAVYVNGALIFDGTQVCGSGGQLYTHSACTDFPLPHRPVTPSWLHV